MGAWSQVRESVRPLVDLVYPPRCPLCGDAVVEQGGLCLGCWETLEVPGEPACTKCARPVGVTVGKQPGQCSFCRIEPPAHSGIYAATLYNDTSRQLVLRFKHGGKIALAKLLGRLMASRLPVAGSGAAPLLIPVPLHRGRLWGRGYNQAALLARELARHGKGELLIDGLVRRKRTPSLGGLGQEQRRKALAGAIAIRTSRSHTIEGRDVILVDDVLTSGATSNACVSALLAGGAASVKIACFARVTSGQSESNRGPKTETPEAITAPGAT